MPKGINQFFDAFMPKGINEFFHAFMPKGVSQPLYCRRSVNFYAESRQPIFRRLYAERRQENANPMRGVLKVWAQLLSEKFPNQEAPLHSLPEARLLSTLQIWKRHWSLSA